MERNHVWDNKTTSNPRGDKAYGLPKNQTAINFLKIHHIPHCAEMDSREIMIFLTFSTFDGEFVVL